MHVAAICQTLITCYWHLVMATALLHLYLNLTEMSVSMFKT